MQSRTWPFVLNIEAVKWERAVPREIPRHRGTVTLASASAQLPTECGGLGGSSHYVERPSLGAGDTAMGSLQGACPLFLGTIQWGQAGDQVNTGISHNDQQPRGVK